MKPESSSSANTSSTQIEKDSGGRPANAHHHAQTSIGSLTKPPLPPVPDGGLQAWLTVLGGFLVLFCTFGIIQAFGVFQDYYTRISLTDKTPSDISWIGSLQLFLLFALGIPAGTLFDLGYFKQVMAFGSLLYVFSTFMTSLTKPHHYYQTILAQGLGEGLGMGLLYLPTISIISHYFRRRRSFAFGIVISGTAVGGVIWPILFNKLFNDRTMFGWGVRASGFIILGLLLIANLIMKTRLPSRKERPGYEKPDFKAIVTDAPYIVTLAGGCLIFWGILFPFFYLELFAVVHGIDPTISLYIIPILNAGAVMGRIVPSFAADYIGPFNVLLTFTIISGGLMFAMFGATNNAGIIVFAILYGFFSGAFLSLIGALAAIFSRSLNEIGIRIGFACFILSFFLLTGAPISGALIGSLDTTETKNLTWSRAIVFNGVVVLAGCVLIAYARRCVARRRGTFYV